MAFNLQTYGRMSSRIGNRTVSSGSTEIPQSISVTGNVYEFEETVANGANSVVYNDQLGTFAYLWLQSDYNTRVLITDTNNNTFSFQLRGTGTANKFGVEFKLALDETTDASNTVNTVQVFNTSGSTAKVLCVVVE